MADVSAYERERLANIDRNNSVLRTLGLVGGHEAAPVAGPAAMPAEVTQAITVKGAMLAWCLVHGVKPLENRHVRLPSGWLGVHVGESPIDPAHAELCAGAGAPPEHELLGHRGKIVGAIRVDGACRTDECVGPAAQWAAGPFCNIIGACCVLEEPVPVTVGALGVWRIGPAALDRVRRQLGSVTPAVTEPSSLPNVTLPPLGSRLPAPSAAARGSSSAAPPRARASARLDGVARPQYNDDAPPETKRDVRRDGAAPARKKRRIGEHSADADAHVRHELCAVEADADLLRVRLFTLGDVALFAGRFVDVDGLQLQVSTRRGQAEPVSSTQTILLPLPLADAQVVDKSYENGVWTLSFKLAQLRTSDWT